MGFLDFLKSDSNSNKNKVSEVKARNPFNLRVGDIIEYDLVEYEVIGKIIYEEGGYEWYDYHLLGNGKHLWLFAEEDDQISLVLFNKIPNANKLYAELQRGHPATINFDGKQYSLVEEGEANINVIGKVGAKTGQRVKYADYRCNNQWISVEEWGNELEINVGTRIKESLLEYYPGE
ncbi:MULTISPECIES: DUF4178 domain-containing protein [unclassified Candidatus Frackibacter]|uniref:DUF4178 domain-containing protein n=1 Tax=unclassified Candidatus Frackibacter TaxID=2648818 RepID=UPI00079C05F4|nr:MULTISPECIES: DUF4178 domain-containing protein [unclassified Candidatus Frackibacter]KXS41541.1 MAG: hypothetical protein AWU54_1599 [Candidatus Frackibacter sp. T328-2]SDC33391.1 protein of unknown function [Candidatus Frackibacter sp. WG11]SEM57734.1 protein of unknown function [Candidatus Frackibacter sp. WG12]SFM09463.1 protein of unknown function [Candidatus Frackibacter sp. WG13]